MLNKEDLIKHILEMNDEELKQFQSFFLEKKQQGGILTINDNNIPYEEVNLEDFYAE